MAKLATRVLSVLTSATTMSAAFYAFMGIGFSGAHLIFAAVLPVEEYATLTLAIAFVNLAFEFAPLGAQGVILRQRLAPDFSMLFRVVAAAILVSASFAIILATSYGLDRLTATITMFACATGAATAVAAAYYQSAQRFGIALPLDQSGNIYLIAGALIALALPSKSLYLPMALLTVGYLLTAVVSWSSLLANETPSTGDDNRYSWKEAISYLVVGGAVPVLLQFERLLIPKLLTLEDLANFGVLAALVVAPYRTLQMAATFATTPRIRAIHSVSERQVFLRNEVFILAVLTASGGLLLIWIAPIVVEFIYGSKFNLPVEVICAAILVGVIKVFCGLAKGVAVALCDTQELANTGKIVWLSAVASLFGALIGSRWHLAGFIVGFGLGWVVMLAIYVKLAFRHLSSLSGKP